MNTERIPSTRTTRRRRAGEQGFALLTVLFLGAAILIGLALSLPRAAMQAQRIREERLIYRGEQYQRAIELYFRAHKKYPSDIDDLEETNGVRFLRQRYKDPVNEDEEWRLIRMGSDGRFQDSLIHDLEDPEQQEQEINIGFGRSRNGQTRRGSGSNRQPFRVYTAAGPAPYAPTDGRFRGADRAREVRESAAPDVLGANRQTGWIPGRTEPTNPNVPAQFDENGNPVPPQNAREEDPHRPQQAQYPGYSRIRPSQIPNQPQAGFPGSQPGNPQNSNNRGPNWTGRVATGFGGITAPGVPFGAAPNPGARPQAVGGQAAEVIRGILSSPRPGGLAGIRNNRSAQSSQGSFEGGIAGVATKAQEMGVKRYGGRESYHEWEFVYDYRKDGKFGGAGVGPGAGRAATQPLPTGQPGSIPSGTPGTMPGVPGTGAFPPGYPTTGLVQPSAAGRGRQDTSANPYERLQTGPRVIQRTPQQGFGPQPGHPPFRQQPGIPGFGPSRPGGTTRQPGAFPGVLPAGTAPGLQQPSNPGSETQPGVIYGPDGTPLPRRLR